MPVRPSFVFRILSLCRFNKNSLKSAGHGWHADSERQGQGQATPEKGVPKKRPAAAAAAATEADSVEEGPENTPKRKATPKKPAMKRPAASQSAGAVLKRPSIRDAEEGAADGERGDAEAPAPLEGSAPVAPEVDAAAALEGSAPAAPEVDAAPHGDGPPARRSALRRPAAASQAVRGAKIFDIFVL